jgi:hypothetical protein
MLQWLWRKLDEAGWPQRLVARISRRRAVDRLARYFLPSGSATHAVCLGVTSPTLATKDLFDAALPTTFGAWRDYQVIAALSAPAVVVAVVRETRTRIEFSLAVPRHVGFDRREFMAQKTLRLTCEAERAGLVTVRKPDGKLLACGTLELVPRAAYSREVQP